MPKLIEFYHFIWSLFISYYLRYWFSKRSATFFLVGRSISIRHAFIKTKIDDKTKANYPITILAVFHRMDNFQNNFYVMWLLVVGRSITILKFFLFRFGFCASSGPRQPDNKKWNQELQIHILIRTYYLTKVHDFNFRVWGWSRCDFSKKCQFKKSLGFYNLRCLRSKLSICS